MSKVRSIVPLAKPTRRLGGQVTRLLTLGVKDHVMDVLAPHQRSFCMAQNRGRDTGPEVRLRKALFGQGLRYGLRSKLSGRPDLVFTRFRVVVFVDGCVWHGCPRHWTAPKSNAEFWARKIASNQARDVTVTAMLCAQGWKVIR